ncbi:transposase family protein [Streptomyces goshikiensis]|uniref:transposase family protein n=1 Tax=Streptomyces goshikiensis TaxID=1942 RepID=UPI003677AA20
MVDAACCGPPGPCPLCQHPAARVHSRYWRYIAGLPAGCRQVIVRLRVRRFFCDQSQCRRRTYVEQVAGLTEPRLRASTAARSAMRAVAVELGGRPGQRLCAKLRIHGLRTALLGQLAAQPVPTRAPRILGIDAFAFREGRTYGTVLVDVESSRPVDVLPDHETGTIAAWLQEHPGAESICRDCLMAFTKAIRQAAPPTRWRWQIAGTCSRTSRRRWRRPAAGTVTASDGQPDQRRAGRWPHRIVRSWTRSGDATRRSTSSPPPACR